MAGQWKEIDLKAHWLKELAMTTIYELLYGASPTKQGSPQWALLSAEIILGYTACEVNWIMSYYGLHFPLGLLARGFCAGHG